MRVNACMHGWRRAIRESSCSAHTLGLQGYQGKSGRNQHSNTIKNTQSQSQSLFSNNNALLYLIVLTHTPKATLEPCLGSGHFVNCFCHLLIFPYSLPYISDWKPDLDNACARTLVLYCDLWHLIMSENKKKATNIIMTKWSSLLFMAHYMTCYKCIF